MSRPFRMAREDAAEIEVARGIGGIEQQRMTVSTHLRTDDRFDPRRLGRLHELNNSVKIARVRQRHGGQIV